ncbi:MAG TPA: DUF427 domain-containing protein [Deltaproteobacteria bacterium]|nr:DUF427 domain-containing protein [Deltaproteobacteria bacterium]
MAWEAFPEHRIEIDAQPIGLRVLHDGRILAETTRGLLLREGHYPPVVYIPREDVRMTRLARSDHSTHCPFKGDASYYDVRDDPEATRIAWSYETPFDQMSAIRNHLAFYTDRLTTEALRVESAGAGRGAESQRG